MFELRAQFALHARLRNSPERRVDGANDLRAENREDVLLQLRDDRLGVAGFPPRFVERVPCPGNAFERSGRRRCLNVCAGIDPIAELFARGVTLFARVHQTDLRAATKGHRSALLVEAVIQAPALATGRHHKEREPFPIAHLARLGLADRTVRKQQKPTRDGKIVRQISGLGRVAMKRPATGRSGIIRHSTTI